MQWPPHLENVSQVQSFPRCLSHLLLFLLRRRSGPQGSIEPFTFIQDPAAWTVADWAGREDWIYSLTASDLAELDLAVAAVEVKGVQQEVGHSQIHAQVTLHRVATVC